MPTGTMDNDGSAYALGEPTQQNVEQQQTASPAQGESGQKPTNLAAWESIASFWDGTLGEGNDMFLQLLLPAVEELASVRPGQKVLDLGTGNGIVANRLSQEGVEVLATDFSAAQIENARRRAEKANKSIRFELLDLTDPVALNNFAKQHAEEFDVITASMLLKNFQISSHSLNSCQRS
ncbi:S-adenosyl-L-methionine-dependent methyltransferase [Xylaria acuta]|nr:S-adenosyl-L-methionine-dependent methyltransferase [Xylaria acuta]